MKSKRLHTDYLNDILDCIIKIEKFIGRKTYLEFSRDEKTVFAVARAFEIIGEATKKIPTALRNQHSNIAWKSMAGMRDKLAHEYFGVNLKVVWKTSKERLPTLKTQIKDLLKTESNDSKT